MRPPPPPPAQEPGPPSAPVADGMALTLVVTLDSPRMTTAPPEPQLGAQEFSPASGAVGAAPCPHLRDMQLADEPLIQGPLSSRTACPQRGDR